MINQTHYQILASLLSADFARLGEEAQSILAAGVDGIHFDVMDNHYVPNLTLGPMGCEALRKFGITAPIDVHLMTDPVDGLISDFAKAGADAITIHPEGTSHLDRSLQLIKDMGCKVGLALNPGTPIFYLHPVLQHIDFILVMAVNPGFGGQAFLQSTLHKLAEIKTFLQTTSYPALPLIVDGGVKIDNIKSIAQAGAEQFVLGSALFLSKDYKKTVSALREQLL